MKLHEYIVTEVNAKHPSAKLNRLEVGSKLILPWHGKTHALQTEHKGKVEYLCSVAHVGRYEKPAATEGEEA